MIHGVDVSHHNGILDWSSPLLAQALFVWAKCAEGDYNRDPRFQINYSAAKDLGKLAGAYHFFRPTHSVESQLNWFFSHYNPKPGDLLPMFDGETLDGTRPSAWKSMALAFCQGVKDRIGKWPVVYLGGFYFHQDLGDTSAFNDMPLCVVDYNGHSAPRVHPNWPKWAFWQYIDKNGLDLDLFNGSEEDLKKFTI